MSVEFLSKNTRAGGWSVTAALSVAILALAISILVSWLNGVAPTLPDDAAKLATCRIETQKALALEKVTISILGEISSLCQWQSYGEGFLRDFNLRKNTFDSQHYQTYIVLWMVVAITLSGVALAGLQLLAAYKLASAGRAEFNQGGQVTLEANKVSVQSSVTGLLILTVSFAFFLVYVLYVYRITEVNPNGLGGSAPVANAPVQPAQLSPGGVRAPKAPGTESTAPAATKQTAPSSTEAGGPPHP
jgi:hypothetical protein